MQPQSSESLIRREVGKRGKMNEIVKAVSFHFEGLLKYHIADKNGALWFAAKDIAAIIEVKHFRNTIAKFPKNEFTTMLLKHSGENGKIIPHKLLILSEDGVFRFLRKSKKPVANQLMDQIGKIITHYRQHPNINWAALPRPYTYYGKEITWTEYFNIRWEKYLKRHPDASPEEIFQYAAAIQ